MLNNDHITEFDVPEPYFYPCGAPKYQISSQAKPVDYEDSLGYKAILAKILSYNPELNPNKYMDQLFDKDDGQDDFTELDDVGQRMIYRKVSCDLSNHLKDFLLNQQVLCSIGTYCDCTFMDILKCLFSYYGVLVFKRPQFIRWILKTVNEYSPETKKTLNIPDRPLL